MSRPQHARRAVAPRADPRGARPLRLCLLGPPRLVEDGVERRIDRKHSALLAYLALERAASRERLAALLWPEGSAAAARNSLRQALFTLRKCGPLLEGGAVLSLSEKAEVDLRSLATVALTLEPPPTLLLGFEFDDCPDFAAWLYVRRQRIADRLKELLAERAERAGDLSEAIRFWRLSLELDPLSEPSTCALMRALHCAGDRPGALVTFQRLATLLRRELGVDPLPETAALAREIERGVPGPTRKKPVPLPVIHPPLVGREEAWAALERAWERDQIIFVCGEPGVGKSRLLREFAATKGKWLALSGRLGDAAVPFATNARLVRTIFAAHPEVSLPRWAREALVWVAPELNGDSPPRGRFEREALLRAEALLLLATAGNNPILLADDLQFFDPDSLEAGKFIASQVWAQRTGLKSLNAYRKGELPASFEGHVDTLISQGLAYRLELPPLGKDAVRRLVAGSGPVEARALGDPLFRATGGNPLFLVEALRSLCESGDWAGAREGRLPLPERVRSLIGQRLARLSPRAIRLARLMAITLRGFTLEFAQAALEVSGLEVAEALSELQRAQLVDADGFTHDLLLDAVRAGTPPAVGGFLHRRAAQYLPLTGFDRTRLAEHWRAAGEVNRAADCVLQLADQARSPAGALREWLEWVARTEEVSPARRRTACRLLSRPTPV